MDHARGVEVLANLVEYVAALRIECGDSEGVRIGLSIRACDPQFFQAHIPRSLLRRTVFFQSSELVIGTSLFARTQAPPHCAPQWPMPVQRSTIVHDCVHTKPACRASQCRLRGPAIGVLNVNEIGTAMDRRQLEVHREHARAQLSWAIRHGGDPELLDLIRFQIDRLSARIGLLTPPPPLRTPYGLLSPTASASARQPGCMAAVSAPSSGSRHSRRRKHSARW